MSAKSALGSRVPQPMSLAEPGEAAECMASPKYAVGVGDNVPQSCCCILLMWVVQDQELEVSRDLEDTWEKLSSKGLAPSAIFLRL